MALSVIQVTHTNVQENCAIFLLIYDMVIEDLVVERLWLFSCGRHCGELKGQ